MSMGRWRKQEFKHNPDSIDCTTMLNEIGSNWGMICKIEVKIDFDFKTVIIRAGYMEDADTFVCEYQALNKVPHRGGKPLEAMIYSVLWDIYQQADTGIAGFRPHSPYSDRALRSRR